MATMLETYQASKNSFDTGIQIAAPGPTDMWRQQEILYRIEVLETCQMFVKTAPSSADAQTLLPHYQMVDAYLRNLTLERRYGLGAVNEENQKQRDTAHNSLLRVIEDYRRRFGSFAPGGDVNCYRKTIMNVIQIVLPVWVQYRQTYIEIPKGAV